MKSNQEKEISPLKVAIAAFILMIITYFALVQVWEITSEVYKPANSLDYQVKTPAHSDDWFERATHSN